MIEYGKVLKTIFSRARYTFSASATSIVCALVRCAQATGGVLLHSYRWYWGLSGQHRSFLAIKLGLLALAIWWFYYTPSPAQAAVLIAVVAAAMSVHGDMRPWQKVVWMVILGLFVMITFRAIEKDTKTRDSEEAAVRGEEASRFDTIARGIEQAIQDSEKQSKERQQEFHATMNSMKGLWSETTGGNSYLYFEISSVGGPIGIDIPGAKKGSMIVSTLPRFVGSYPLHNVSLQIFGTLGDSGKILDYGTVLPPELGRWARSPELVFWPGRPEYFFFIFINTSNGSYEEMVFIRRVGNKWPWACRLYKTTGGVPHARSVLLRAWTAPGFPYKYMPAGWLKASSTAKRP